eukprot:scaffold1123_cov168-Amphora_coffeaeformis.AAC.36
MPGTKTREQQERENEKRRNKTAAKKEEKARAEEDRKNKKRAQTRESMRKSRALKANTRMNAMTTFQTPFKTAPRDEDEVHNERRELERLQMLKLSARKDRRAEFVDTVTKTSQRIADRAAAASETAIKESTRQIQSGAFHGNHQICQEGTAAGERQRLLADALDRDDGIRDDALVASPSRSDDALVVSPPRSSKPFIDQLNGVDTPSPERVEKRSSFLGRLGGLFGGNGKKSNKPSPTRPASPIQSPTSPQVPSWAGLGAKDLKQVFVGFDKEGFGDCSSRDAVDILKAARTHDLLRAGHGGLTKSALAKVAEHAWGIDPPTKSKAAIVEFIRRKLVDEGDVVGDEELTGIAAIADEDAPTEP